MRTVNRINDIYDKNLDFYRSLAVSCESSNGQDNYFIVETHVVIQNALEAGCIPISFLVAEKYIEGRDKNLLNLFPDCPVYTAPENVLEGLIGYKLTRGILCAISRPPKQDYDDLIQKASVLVVLENVQDASNIGAIMRSACSLGADAVLLDHSCCDPLHRKAIRTSTGAVFKIPWSKADTSGSSLAEKMNKSGFRTLAFALTPKAVPINQAVADPHERVALFFGSEGNGLSKQTIETCNDTIMIPMKNNYDSLNVATAASIAIWEYSKNR